MRVYIETGILIDYLAQGQYISLRSASRKGRDRQCLFKDAQELLYLVSEKHYGSISAFSFYEVEEAMYKQIADKIKGVAFAETLRLEACRPILTQAITAARLFNLTVIPLTGAAVEFVSNSKIFTDKALRAADSLHMATACNHEIDLIVSADQDVLKMDGLINNNLGISIRCLDSDAAIEILRLAIL